MQQKAELPDDGERMIPELHRNSLAYADHIARYESALPFVQGKTVLDIASGSGYGTRMISQYAKKVYGVDISEDAVAYAKQNYDRKNINFICGSGTSIPLEDNSVDVVTTFETLEHIEQAEKFIQEIARVLRPDGTLVLSTPNDIEFPEGNHFHVHEFEYDELKEMIGKHFKHMESYFQATWIYTGIDKIDEISKESDRSMRVIQSAPIQRDKALFFMWVCSSKPIKTKVAPIGVVGEHWSVRKRAEQDKDIEKYIKKTIKHFEKIITAKDNQIALLNKDIETIRQENSNNNVSMLSRIKHVGQRKK